MKIAIPKIINFDQSGFLKGRYIGQNITTIMDLMHFTTEENISALIIAVDFEKAFDTLWWTFMYQCLEKFKFPPLIKQWIRILYTDIKSCVTNNGWSSEYFYLERGVRQGCPLSPYMFILCAEILAQQVRNNTKIEGINIGGKEFKIKQYADDTQIFIKYSVNSLTELISTFVEYSNISGLKINFDKTEVMRIGSIKHSSCIIKTQPMLKWTQDVVKILGISLTTDPSEVLCHNIYPAFEKIQNIIKIWSSRKLTLFGKITVIKSLLESQLLYKLSVLPTPSCQLMKQIDQTLFNFLWDNKPHRITKQMAIEPRSSGGLSMTDIYTKNMALEAAWVKRIIADDNYSNFPVINHYMKTDLKLLLRCNISATDMHQCWTTSPPTFWKDVFYQWCCYNYTKIDDIKTLGKEILWYNSNIKIGHRLVYYKELCEKNVLYVSDLFDANNKFMSYSELKEKYKTNINYLHYMGLIQAIPKRYKQLVLENKKGYVMIILIE